MDIVAIVFGALLLTLVMCGCFAATAWAAGWRFALGLWAFALSVTAVIVCGALLLSWGIAERL